MAQRHSSPPPTLCSWPPNPALLSLQLLARGIVVLTDMIGFSVLFAAGFAWEVAARAPAIVGGSFLLAAMIITPFMMLWNGRILKRAKKMQHKQQQNSDADKSPPKFGTKALKFIAFLDGFGALVFFTVFFPVIVGASAGDRWWDTSSSNRIMYAYGSVSVLIAAIIHFFLFTTQALQLHSNACARKARALVCPHCSHSLARVSTSSDFRTPPESMGAEGNDSMLVESLVDTRISMNPGQETGTTFKTPRQSEHQSRAQASTSPEGEANEAGEGEQDTLISKSG